MNASRLRLGLLSLLLAAFANATQFAPAAQPTPDQNEAARDSAADNNDGEAAPLAGQWRGVRRDGSQVLVSIEQKDKHASVQLEWLDKDGERVTVGSKDDARVFDGFTRFQIEPDPQPYPNRRETWKILIKLEEGKLRLQRVAGIDNETVFLTKVKGADDPADPAPGPVSPDDSGPFTELTAFAGRRKSLSSCVTLSPDGKVLAMAAPDIDSEAVVLDIESRKELQRLQLDGVVEALTWSGDGSTLVVGSASSDSLLQTGEGRQVGVWNTATWEQRALFEHPRHPASIACSADGRMIAAAAFVNSSQLGFLQVWDSTAKKELVALREAHAWSPLVVAPKGDSLLCGINSGKARFVRFALPGGKQSDPQNIRGGIAVMALTRDGRGMATAGARSGDVQLWVASSLRPVRTISGFPTRPHAICFLDGANYVAVAGSHADVFVFDTKTGEQAYQFPASRVKGIFTLQASADSSRLLTWSVDYVARVWKTPFAESAKAGEDAREASGR